MVWGITEEERKTFTVKVLFKPATWWNFTLWHSRAAFRSESLKVLLKWFSHFLTTRTTWNVKVIRHVLEKRWYGTHTLNANILFWRLDGRERDWEQEGKYEWREEQRERNEGWEQWRNRGMKLERTEKVWVELMKVNVCRNRGMEGWREEWRSPGADGISCQSGRTTAATISSVLKQLAAEFQDGKKKKL